MADLHADERSPGRRFETVTRCALKVLLLAQEEAQRLGQHVVAPEHVLLAIGKADSCDGRTILRDLHVDLFRLRQDLDAILQGESYPPRYPARLGHDGVRVVVLARDEATRLGHSSVGTGHLLLGILQADGPGADLLRRSGVTLEGVRQQMAQASEPEGAGARAGAPSPVAIAPTASGTPDLLTVTCPVSPQMFDVLDLLVDAGEHRTLNAAAAALLTSGVEANRWLVDRLYALADQLGRPPVADT